jgi:hypothetical protein
LKQRGVLPADYIIGRRRVKNYKPADASEEPKISKYIPKANIRGRARRVELKLIDDETFQPRESQIFPSFYNAGKFLGAFNSVVVHFNGRCYKSKINGKTYRVKILDHALA